MSMFEKEEVEEINKIPQTEMARLWRFTPAGHPWFDSTKPFFKIFEKRFNELGGSTPSISKSIGWEE